MSNTASVSWVASESGQGSFESAAMSYTGSATSSYSSDKSVAVDATANTDAQSGSYTATGIKSDWSTMSRIGGSVGPMYGVNWNYGSTLASGISITDSGTYPNGGLVTVESGGGRIWGEGDVFSINSPSINFHWTTGYQSSTSAPSQSTTQSDSLAQTMADPGPDAPQEAKDGQQPADLGALEALLAGPAALEFWQSPRGQAIGAGYPPRSASNVQVDHQSVR